MQINIKINNYKLYNNYNYLFFNYNFIFKNKCLVKEKKILIINIINFFKINQLKN